jgi:ATP-dependent Lhr-like helicase
VQELAGEALLAGRTPSCSRRPPAARPRRDLPDALAAAGRAPPADGVGALYIAPIKALLNNQADRLGLYTEMVGLRRFVWHGDIADQPERRASCASPPSC